jgi:hypothetical protein
MIGELAQKAQTERTSFRWHTLAASSVALLSSDCIAPAQTFNCKLPVPTLKEQMIQESIARYPGNCPCPYNRDARGHNCGGRSAWSRAGGYAPLCFSADITPDMVREFCEVLKLRGAG